MPTKDELIQRIKSRSMSQPLRNYLWRVVLPMLDYDQSIVHGDGTDAEFELLAGDNFEVSSRVASISVPNFMFDIDKSSASNGYWKFAKKYDIGSIAMDIYEYEDGLTLKYIDAWRQQIVNTNGTYNPPAIYKKQIKMYRLSASKEDLIVSTYDGVFVSQMADITSDYENGDLLKFTVNFQTDEVKHEIKAIKGMDYTPNDISILKDILGVDRLVENAVDTLSSIVKSQLPPRLQSLADADSLSRMKS